MNSLTLNIKKLYILLFCFVLFKSHSQNVKLNNSQVVKLGKIEISEEELTKFGEGPDRLKAVEVEKFLASHPEWRLPTIDELLKMYDERNTEYHAGKLNNMIPALYLCYGLNSGTKIPDKYSNRSWYNKASSEYFWVNFNGGNLDLDYGNDCFVRLVKTNKQPISDNTINNDKKDISNATVSNAKILEDQNCDQAKRKYLEQNPDVAKAGMDAWSHYNSYGKKEGRKWPSCSEKQENKISNTTVSNAKILEETNCESARKKYLEQNPDVAKAGMDAWRHYTIFGKEEGRKWPSCSEKEENKISSTTVSNTKILEETNCESARKKYLEQNPDVAKAGMDSWSHYTVFGKKEGRKWPSCSSDKNNIYNVKDYDFGINELKYSFSGNTKSSEFYVKKQILGSSLAYLTVNLLNHIDVSDSEKKKQAIKRISELYYNKFPLLKKEIIDMYFSSDFLKYSEQELYAILIEKFFLNDKNFDKAMWSKLPIVIDGVSLNNNLANSKTEGSTPANPNNSKNLAQSTCSFAFKKHQLTYTYIDNRKICCYCEERYAKHQLLEAGEKSLVMSIGANSNIDDEKIKYLAELLYLHLLNTNATEEHRNQDAENFLKFVILNYKESVNNVFGMAWLLKLQSMMKNAGTESELVKQIQINLYFQEPLGNKNRKLNKYKITSKFCRTECEDLCSRYQNCNCQ